MRVLHTADWHLGFSNNGLSRAEDQRRFLAWLRELIVSREVELLLVSGDIFDREMPSSEAMKLYYDFLSSLRSVRSNPPRRSRRSSPNRPDQFSPAHPGSTPSAAEWHPKAQLAPW